MKNLKLEAGLSIYDRGSKHEAYWVNAPKLDTPLVRITSHLWYLSGDLIFKHQIIQFVRRKISIQSGLTYGRKIWAYEIERVYGDSYYYPEKHSSDNPNFLGVIFGLGVVMPIKSGWLLELRPCYIRQLNRGWRASPVMNNDGRYDTYALNLILWFSSCT